MRIFINGEPEHYQADGLSIFDLLTMKKVESPDMVAVQLNGAFVDKQNYGATLIAEDDSLEFLYFMGGGAHR